MPPSETVEAAAVAEAAPAGYTFKHVKGVPLRESFAVIQVGGSQFRVCEGDVIITQKLEGAEVNDEVVLQKVLLLGTRDWTAIGKPILEKAKVYAVVEEQTLTEKVLIFKKKRRKNYRRLKGHSQQITTLRIGPIVSEYEQTTI